jgi:hypothetical protein
MVVGGGLLIPLALYGRLYLQTIIENQQKSEVGLLLSSRSQARYFLQVRRQKSANQQTGLRCLPPRPFAKR